MWQIGEEKLHLFKIQKAITQCGLNGNIINYQRGIHFNRYTLRLNNHISYLEFHKLSKPLCKYANVDCIAYKNDDEYIIDVNRHKRKLQTLDKLCSQTNHYNIFDFKGSKLLINIFNHIMLIDVNKQFFINSLKNFTTSCTLRDDLTTEDIVYLIEHRKHKYFRENQYIENTNLNNIFAIIDDVVNEDINFILKHGKEVGIYLILIANQQMINEYGLKVDYIFYHSDVLETYDIRKISPIIPVNFTEHTSDVYIFNRTFGSRVCIL
jgi:hypothetical protein